MSAPKSRLVVVIAALVSLWTGPGWAQALQVVGFNVESEGTRPEAVDDLIAAAQDVDLWGFSIETAFVNASTSAITPQVTPLIGLPSEPIQIDAKRGVEDIPRLIAKKTQGLLFRLGDSSYYGPAIRQYLVLLSKQPFLRYLILEHPNRTFLGMADARARRIVSERTPAVHGR
jgi:hypothetical protein